MDIKISVIIPVYNVEKYLQDCIDSLLAQTIQDIEFIFVNDASTDSSLEILLENERKYKGKMVVISSKENLKQGGARNIGVNAARGKYIGFVDSDDIVNSKMYQLLHEKAIETNADVTFIKLAGVSEDYNLVTNSGKILNYFQWNNDLINLNEKDLSDDDKMILISHSFGGIVCGLWKKEILIQSGVKFLEKLRYEDNYWSPLICCYINRVAFVDEVGYFYRKVSTSTVNSRNAIHQYDRLTVEKMLMDEVKRRDLYYKYYDAWESLYIYRKTFNSIAMFTRKFDKPDCDIVRVLIKELKEEFPL